MYRRQGLRALHENKFKSALGYFRMALKFEPNNPVVYDGLIAAHKRATASWSDVDMAESLSWEMTRQSLRNAEAANSLTQLTATPHVRPKIIGLTGAMASGKSTVARFLAERGIPTISADAVVHELLAKDGAAVSPLTTAFGESIVASDGSINRAAFAAIIFHDSNKRKRAEAILHPMVNAAMMARAQSSEMKQEPIIVMEIPLLFEAGLKHPFDAVITVAAPAFLRRRWAKQNGFSPADWRRRENAQWPLKKKMQLSDYVIENTGTVDLLRQKVAAIIASLLTN